MKAEPSFNTKTIVNTAIEAGQLLVKGWKNKEMLRIRKWKGVGNYSIKMDRKSESLILKRLLKLKNTSIVTEESGKIGPKGAEYVVYVDPLDGTFNYQNGVPQFCVSIGVYRRGVPYFAAVYDPLRNELFTARHGAGAFMNGRRIHVRRHNRGWPIAVEYTNKIKKFMRRNDTITQNLWCMVLDFCWTACGRYAATIIGDSSPWDIAAGLMIAEEAGAIVTDFKSRPWTVKDHIRIVASANKALHRKLLKEL